MELDKCRYGRALIDTMAIATFISFITQNSSHPIKTAPNSADSKHLTNALRGATTPTETPVTSTLNTLSQQYVRLQSSAERARNQRSPNAFSLKWLATETARTSIIRCCFRRYGRFS